ncbi:MAG: hypothetical protein PUC79_08820, partial [Prevotellaceae bacterium]|nr:hypothetical protein [Prevotellaceae bacterium]
AVGAGQHEYGYLILYAAAQQPALVFGGGHCFLVFKFLSGVVSLVHKYLNESRKKTASFSSYSICMTGMSY